MKTVAKRLLSLALGLCLAVAGVFTIAPTVTASAATNYEETSFGAGKLLITTTFDGETYYLPAATTTSSAPLAKIFTDVNDISEDNLWTVTATGSNWYIKNAAGDYLYTTNTNNGVRVSDTNNAWNYDTTNNSFKDTKTNRFLGIYSAQNWRCYTTVNQSNYKESSTSFKFYKIKEVDDTTANIIEELNGIKSYMSLAYKYTAKTEMVEQSAAVIDTLNNATTGASGTTYLKWSANNSSEEIYSSATYAGDSAGDNSSIQLRSKNNHSGIITTESGGKVSNISIKWNSKATSGTLDVYAKNTAYSAATDLYSSSTQGTKIGSIKYGESSELVIEGDYEYIGLRSASGAIYLDSIAIEWNGNATAGGTEEVTVLENSDFRIKCGIDASISTIEGIESFGIRVTASGKTKDYTVDNAKSWATDTVNNVTYVIISLGEDAGKDLAKLETRFTVQAFVVIEGETYLSDIEKTHSVATMVAEYYEAGYAVEHLYNYLNDKGLI